ncbi:Ribosome-recycling factor (RRF) (Ribosome-releasing factor), partial [Durusdinium trenchii]
TIHFGKKKGKGGGGGGGGGSGGGGVEAVDIDTEALIKDYEEKMRKSFIMLEDNLRTIRAGKATPQLLDSVKVNAYESQLKIEEVATITVSDATTLMVNVFDDTVVDAVAKAILKADLGFTASTFLT